MAQKKVFLSFDFDNNLEIKNSFIAQAGLPDSPFSINDYSLREAHPIVMSIIRPTDLASNCR